MLQVAQAAAARTPNDLVALTGELGPPAVIAGNRMSAGPGMPGAA
jgi:hypothetical protein